MRMILNRSRTIQEPVREREVLDVGETLCKVVVVIPVYKEKMSQGETMSLDRCRTVLACHPRVLVAPRRLNVDCYLARDPALAVARFEDNHFTSLLAYSGLCLKPEFYARFLNYEYMLIYQLDCYVFRDELLAWCQKGYDYIGAPWPKYEHMTESRKWIARIPLLKSLLRNAGQGGFSLRRVATLYRAAQSLAFCLNLLRTFHEDVIWTTLAGRFYRPFRLAGLAESLPFSFASSFELCYELNGRTLPFGCHGWYTYGRKFWADKIEMPKETAERGV